MRILFFVDCLHVGGKERRLVELVKNMQARTDIGFDLAVMSDVIGYPEVFDAGVNIHYLLRRTKKDVNILRRLYNLCRQLQPDIIHAWDSMTAMYALPVAKVLGIKLVNGMITDAPERIPVFTKLWLRTKITFPFSDAIVSNSRMGLSAYGVRSRKGVCVYNGFDDKRLMRLRDPRAVRASFQINTPKVVGMVGAFADRKDFKSFVRAAEDILRRRDDVTFIMVGDGKNLNQCKQMVDERFQNNIKFLGWQEDVESIINTFTVGVLLTNTDVHGEGISNSILEYMALGKPVVATDSGGTREIVADGTTGYLVRSKDVCTLSDRINYLLDNEAQAQTMGMAGKKRVSESFSIDAMVTAYVNLYQSVLQNGRVA